VGRPRVAIFDFACCEGCQLQLVNLEEEILGLLSLVEPVEWREAISDHSDQYDIALIEGSITRAEDEQRLRAIRERAKVLIAVGACAAIGGVNKLKHNLPNLEAAQRIVYGDAAAMPHLATAATKAVHEVVAVDYQVHGCPMNTAEFAHLVRCLVMGVAPVIPNYPVCVECRRRGNSCRYEYGEICLGVVTRAGCNAPCPSAGFYCFGCRGLLDDPNVNAAREIMEKYRKTPDDLRDRLLMFNSKPQAVDW